MDFARRVLEVLGARCRREAGVLRAELTWEQLQKLEGRPTWAMFGWSPAAADSVATLYLSADGEEASEPEAEPLLPGSHRLQQLCAVALGRGAVGRAFLVPADDKRTRLRPYLVFHFRLRYVGHDVRERTDAVAVDLVTGDARSCPSLAELPLQERGGGLETENARLTVGEAHERAVKELCRRIADEDAMWFYEKRRWIEQELDRLYAYLQRVGDEFDSEETLAVVRDARLFELRELNRPRVEVRAEAATVLYAPPYWLKPSAMYLSRRRQ